MIIIYSKQIQKITETTVEHALPTVSCLQLSGCECDTAKRNEGSKNITI